MKNELDAKGEKHAASKPTLGSLNPEALRLSQDFGADLGVKKALVTVPVRKPGRQDFFRVHPDGAFQLQTAVIELKEERETYLVDKALWPELGGEIAPKILYTTLNRQGVLALWPVRLPGPDGRQDNWSRSALEAARMAKEGWVRMQANMNLGAYDVFHATGDFGEPEWPEVSFEEILGIAFQNQYIQDMNHPVVRRLRGLS